MTPKEKERFLFEQTCALIAGRLGNTNTPLAPDEYIKSYFEKIYKTLAQELDKAYIKTYAK
ncbi:hypothetical protein SNO04_001902 [Cronobacter sakazakii]|uniref:hypothetical protein n=1 Tax=Cronobacter sakazakii TaxID=28141 RepID=UPI000A18E663|nr:hypothetical protein [Cronobacter sakazakii]ELY4122423.1 hypothetical protein [Cronobacter sakazakii]ELY5994539.1 hypothetical protein [Cronobacter sakazakii]PQX80635.1 hypothetical protein C5967_15710 [Cronobacter sakazakii]PQX99661.1 hypothetical protein C5963_12405 [Cronobacter sakazakii]PQY41864.1 hypothetical protein C5965_12040 [Cronobacter sakazakii]